MVTSPLQMILRHRRGPCNLAIQPALGGTLVSTPSFPHKSRRKSYAPNFAYCDYVPGTTRCRTPVLSQTKQEQLQRKEKREIHGFDNSTQNVIGVSNGTVRLPTRSGGASDTSIAIPTDIMQGTKSGSETACGQVKRFFQ